MNLPPKAPYKQVIVMRKDLNMRKGKIAAQAAHASLAAVIQGAIRSKDFIRIPNEEALTEWLNGSFRKICVYVNSEDELMSVYLLAKKLGLRSALITDRGDTEFGGVPTRTCCAIGPDTNERIDEVTAKLPLY